MGLVKCVDCGKTYSDRIENCPNCGCPKDVCSPLEAPVVSAQTTCSSESTTKQVVAEPARPSSTKSFTIIGVLLFVMFSCLLSPYLENQLLCDYAVAFGLIETASVSLFMLVFPVFYVVLADNRTLKSIKRICVINSIATFLISVFLQSIRLSIPFPTIGGLGAIIYYFINKHILLQIDACLFPWYKTKAITTLRVCTALLLVIVLIGSNYCLTLIEKLT